MTTRDETAAKIAALNDAFRKGERPELGRIMITSGARATLAPRPLDEIVPYKFVFACCVAKSVSEAPLEHYPF